MTTISDLEKILTIKNVPKDSYSLTGGLPNEEYCIGYTGQNWEVYYSERGLKTGLKSFNSENEACVYFLEQLRKSGLLQE